MSRITDKATLSTKKRLKKFLKHDMLMPLPSNTWVVPVPDTLRSGYGISIDFQAFENEFIHNQSIGDLPIDFFRQFKPAILQERIKAEVKFKMEPSYRTIPLETGVKK